MFKRISNFFVKQPQVEEPALPAFPEKKFGDDRVAVILDCSGMGDCLFAIPVLRKMASRFRESTFDLFTYHPELFRRCPYVQQVYPIGDPALDDYLLSVKLFDLSKLAHNEVDTMDFITIPAGLGQLSFREKQLEYFPQEEDLAESYDVVLNTSVTWPTRTWKLENWQRLAEALLAKGLTVAVVGKDVHAACDDMLKVSLPLDGCVNLVNRLSLDQTYFVIRKCGLFVSCQNGLSVLAGATETEIIVLDMSIEWSKRAIYRHENPFHKISYVNGTCDIYCGEGRNMCQRPEFATDGEFRCIPSYETVEAAVMAKLSTRKIEN